MAIHIPEAGELAGLQDALAAEQMHGVAGIKEFNSGVPGPRVILSMGTHGNEAAPFAALAPFLKGQIELKKGSVVAVMSNLPAVMAPGKKEGERGQRKVENLDFNRLPKDILDPDARAAYLAQFPESVKRLHDLKDAGALDGTHGVDGHNVFGASDPILLQLKGDDRFSSAIGVPVVIDGISGPQRDLNGDPSVCFGDFVGGFDNKEAPVVEIEGGGPGTEAHVIKGLMSGVLSTLASLDMIDPAQYGLTEKELKQKVYKTTGWQMAPDGFRVNRKRDTKPFALVREGAELLSDAKGLGRSPIIVPQDSRLLFPIPNQDVLDGADDWFYADPTVKTRKTTTWTL